jgi:hypothetical protein
MPILNYQDGSSSPYSSSIDFDIPVESESTVELLSIKDTVISEGAPDHNYGSLSYMTVRAADLPSGDNWIMVDFDVHDNLPSDATINDAILFFRTRDGNGVYNPTPGTFYIARSRWGWEEAYATWNNKPHSWYSATLYPYHDQENSVVGYRITALVQEIVDAGWDHGFLLMPNDDGQTRWNTFYTKEGDYRPRLRITYEVGKSSGITTPTGEPSTSEATQTGVIYPPR